MKSRRPNGWAKNRRFRWYYGGTTSECYCCRVYLSHGNLIVERSCSGWQKGELVRGLLKTKNGKKKKAKKTILSSCGIRCSRIAYMGYEPVAGKVPKLACRSVVGIDYSDDGRIEHTWVGTWGQCNQGDVHPMTRRIIHPRRIMMDDSSDRWSIKAIMWLILIADPMSWETKRGMDYRMVIRVGWEKKNENRRGRKKILTPW